VNVARVTCQSIRRASSLFGRTTRGDDRTKETKRQVRWALNQSSIRW
jgi:hypothetical protein